MLQNTTDSTGNPYYSGPATGSVSPSTQGALKRFQADNGLDADGVAGDDTRRALIGKYMALEGTSLPAGTPILQHGCGKFHPIDPTSAADQGNRRVEIFLFDGAIEPPPQSPCPSPGCPEYLQWIGNPEEDIDLCKAKATGRLRVRLFDSFTQPLANVVCKLFADGQELFAGNTDSDGFVQTGELELPDRCQVKWAPTSTMPPSDDLLIYTLDAFVNLDGQGDDAAVRMRLSNLGYRFGDAMRDDIKAFQRERGLPETGEVSDVKDQLAAVHDSFAPASKPAPAPFFMSSSHEP
jgi:peptidoglycan hydrolase-like protein with peptidoglycan-binding domain